MKNFGWVLPGVLAGSERPGFHTNDEPGDLEFLAAQGVKSLVTLTKEPVPAASLSRAGLNARHIPIADLSAPVGNQVAEFVAFVDSEAAAGRGVVAHCLYGVGRTGTMLACYLVHKGMPADRAIAEIRRLRPGSIETDPQAQAVFSFARSIGR